MYHSVLYAFNNGAAAAYTRSSAPIIPGPGDTPASSKYFPTQDVRLLSVMGYGVSLTEVLLNTPYLSSLAPMEVRPIALSTLPVTDQNVADYSDNMPLLKMSENIDVQMSDSAGNTLNCALLHMQTSQQAYSQGPRFWTRATSATALTANAWSVINPTFDVNLPQGMYEVQSLVCISATARICRIFTPGNPWKPGVLPQPTIGLRPPWPQWYRKFGPLGRFTTLGYPQFEIYATAADAAQTFFLELVKVS